MMELTRATSTVRHNAQQAAIQRLQSRRYFGIFRAITPAARARNIQYDMDRVAQSPVWCGQNLEYL